MRGGPSQTPPLTVGQGNIFLAVKPLKISVMEFTVLSCTELPSGNYSIHIQSIVGLIIGHKYWIKANRELTAGEIISLQMDDLKVINKETKSGKTIRLLIPRI
jgi:hypothetical protein